MDVDVRNEFLLTIKDVNTGMVNNDFVFIPLKNIEIDIYLKILK